MIVSPARSRQTGFTLLELVLAVLLLTILVGMVFGTARNSLALGNKVVESQNEEMLHQAFFELLNRRFSALPGNTRFDLKSEDSGGKYLSYLTLQNVPLGFTWGGQERIAKTVQLSTVRKRTGYLDIVLSYYENEILEGSESAEQSTAAIDTEPFAQVVLLEDVAYFEWRVLDGNTLEWEYDWEIQGRMPIKIELVMAFGAQGEELRHVFWLPSKQNPEVIMRQMQQSAQRGGGGGGGNNSGGGGGNNNNGGGGNNNGGGGQRGGDDPRPNP